MSGPTGEQIEISQQASRAIVTGVGAGLRLFEVNGVAYTETFAEDEEPPMGLGAVLVPWPNRVAGARWMLDGEPQDLEMTEPSRGNAIHGLVRHEPWTVTERTKSKVSLEVSIDSRQGWPFPFRTTISYELGLRGLNVTHGVHNIGDRTMPFGVGTHPYLRPGNAHLEDCDLKLSATTLMVADPVRMVPNGQLLDTRNTKYDFRRGELLCDVQLDHTFGGCRPRGGGLIKHSIRGRDGGVELWADPSFGWVQVFTPDNFPGARGGFAVAIEPMTCPPDALNSGVGLLHLAPGESWTGRWGIMPL